MTSFWQPDKNKQELAEELKASGGQQLSSGASAPAKSGWRSGSSRTVIILAVARTTAKKYC